MNFICNVLEFFMGIAGFGKRLSRIRKKEGYKSVAEIEAAMNKAGFSISSNQLYELEKGQWPTRSQIVMLSDFFGLPVHHILLGVEGSNNSKLTKEQQVIIELVTKQFIIDNEKLSPPPPNR